MLNQLKVAVFLILTTFAPSVISDNVSDGDQIANPPEACEINTLRELLTFSRSNLDLAQSSLELIRADLDLARSDLASLQRELTEERAARREEMDQLREEMNQLRENSELEETPDSWRQEINRLNQRLDRFNSVAFHAVIQRITSILGTVKFDDVKLNNGNGYSSSTGVFTVPSEGAGLYYFNVYILIAHGEYGQFRLEKNGEILCRLVGDNSNNGAGDTDTGTCAATVELNEGDRVSVEFDSGADNTPLNRNPSYCGLTGFLLNPRH